MRSRETHAHHCSGLGGPLHEHFSITYGVMSNSVLNSSRYFHVVNGTPPDIMHDILEGILQLHIRHLLKYLILQENLFSLDTLNERIQSFLYGPADTCNKPTTISNDTIISPGNCLKQSCKFIIIRTNKIYQYFSFASMVSRPLSITPCW